MSYGMYLSAAGADVQSARLQVISNNLANANTPGFKRDFAILQARHAEAIERGEVAAGQRGIEDLGGGVQMSETVTDFSAGALRQTGNKTDLAINGDGFFLVEKDGEPLLTRAGNFHFSTAGQLQSEQGYPVMSLEGGPVAIDPIRPWSFTEDGGIEQGGDALLLALVQPASLGDLVKAGENMFSPLADVTPVPAADRSVKSGYLEQSGVKPAIEMMELIETSRAYEANIRMIQSQDQVVGSLVNRILRQS
ncbi:MAG: flagellar basal-body rod protein FlgF [Planctomycetota bacterium]|nr:flagellar basal-body rod protein FlgF [Planctomycetota bacterium]